jgi:hypothetical protein
MILRKKNYESVMHIFTHGTFLPSNYYGTVKNFVKNFQILITNFEISPKVVYKPVGLVLFLIEPLMLEIMLRLYDVLPL